MPDCVEVTCREIFDLLLYDPSVPHAPFLPELSHTHDHRLTRALGAFILLTLVVARRLRQSFVPERLPPSAEAGLVGFYSAQLGDDDEAALGQRWFDLCSDRTHARSSLRSHKA